MSQTFRKIAIITGASSGLGAEYSRQIAKEATRLSPQVDEIWIMARRKDRLEALAKELSPFPVKIIAGDLIQSETLIKLDELLKTEKVQINWLINNAGFGLLGAFTALSLSKQLGMIDLNVRALTDLTYRALPYMKENSRAVLVASSAGFFPLPNFAVYAATKAYVVNFANALAAELRPRKITVTAVCPGPIATEFFQVSSKSGKNPMRNMPVATALDVVVKSLKDAQKDRLRSTFGWFYELSICISGIIPRNLLKTRLAELIKKPTEE